MKFTKLSLVLSCLFLNVIAAFAQDSPDKAALKETMPLPIIIPFQLNHKVVIVQAKAGKQEGNFILDTGVAALTLNKRYFTGFESDKIFYDINGNPSKVSETFVDLQMGDWKLRQERGEITDFDALERTLQLPIMGSIGVSAFQKCELVLDYIFQELTIYELDKAGNRKSFYFLHTNPIDTIAFKSTKEMPVILATIGEHALKVGLDTGAGINVVNENLQTKLVPYLTKLSNKDLVGVNSRMRNLEVAQIQTVQVGKLPCAPMRTLFAPMQYFNKNLPGVKIDGIVGYEFLSQFRVAINFRKKEIYLWSKEVVEAQLAMRNGGR